MSDFFKIDENNQPVPMNNLLEWGAWFEDVNNRIIKKTELDNVLVSTVFLGMPHHGGMFETMIFGGEREGEQYRYETAEEAEEHHDQIVNELSGESQ